MLNFGKKRHIRYQNRVTGVCLLLTLAICPLYGQSKKEILAENAALQLKTDSLRQSLAEARREWQKCKDNSNTHESEMAKKLETKDAAIQDLTAKLSKTEKKLGYIADTLSATREACAVLQAEMGKRSLQEHALETKAQILQNELNTSLATWFGSQLSMLRNKERVSLTLSDSLLFNGGARVNTNGQKFLAELVKTITPYRNIKLVIVGWANTDSKEPQTEATRRALLVYNVLHAQKWPPSRMILVGKGAVPEDWKNPKSPIQIDFLPLEDSRF